MKSLLIVFLFCSTGLLTSAQDPLNCWIPWDCDQNYTPLPVGDRRAVAKYFSPQGEHFVMYGVFGSNTTSWHEVGILDSGTHLLDVSYYNSDWSEEGYTNSFFVVLSFTDTAGNTTVSTVKTFTTEPAPPLVAEVECYENEVVATISSNPTDGFNFGELPSCDDFPINLVIRATDQDSLVIFEDTLTCTPGEPVLQSVIFQRPEDVQSVCLSVKMERSSSAQPPLFLPYTISETTTCEDAPLATTVANSWNVTTNAFPNPFQDQLVLPMNNWQILDALGKVVTSGTRANTVSTTDWSPGAYVLKTPSGSSLLIKQ